MTTNNINPDIITTAIRDQLNLDSTLNGSGYLGTAGKIFTNRAPTTETCPYLVVECKDVNYYGCGQFDTEVRIFCHTAILSNGQISTLGNLILYRCQILLNDCSLSITGMSSISLTTTVVPTFYDSDSDESKARGVLRVKLDIGYKI